MAGGLRPASGSECGCLKEPGIASRSGADVVDASGRKGNRFYLLPIRSTFPFFNVFRTMRCPLDQLADSILHRFADLERVPVLVLPPDIVPRAEFFVGLIESLENARQAVQPKSILLDWCPPKCERGWWGRFRSRRTILCVRKMASRRARNPAAAGQVTCSLTEMVGRPDPKSFRIGVASGSDSLPAWTDPIEIIVAG